jgi:hypothetical protein
LLAVGAVTLLARDGLQFRLAEDESAGRKAES